MPKATDNPKGETLNRPADSDVGEVSGAPGDVARRGRVGSRLNNDWIVEAGCLGLDPDAFFPPRDQGAEQAQLALAVCRACQVRAECLEDELTWAISPSRMHGIRGGLTAEDRRALFTDHDRSHDGVEY